MPEENKKDEKKAPIFGRPTDSEKQTIKPKKSPYDSALSSFNEQINVLIRTIRILEERYSNLRKKTQITDQNMLDDVKKINTRIKIIDSEFSEIKKEISNINEKISFLFEQVKNVVKKEDVQVLDRYLNIWDPLRFITFEEARKLIEENK